MRAVPAAMSRRVERSDLTSLSFFSSSMTVSIVIVSDLTEALNSRLHRFLQPSACAPSLAHSSESGTCHPSTAGVGR